MFTINLENIPPNMPPHPRRRRKSVVIGVVFIVAILAISGVVILVNASSQRVGIVPLSEVDDLTGQTLVESNISHSYVYSSYVTPVKLQAAFFNNSNGSEFIEVVSIEWRNQSQSKYLYDVVYSDLILNLPLKVTPKSTNGTFSGFQYEWALLDQGNYYVLLSAGYSGKYSFFIYDSGITITDVSNIAHDEINAMTGTFL